ncbi:MAG: hypothetical protein ACHQ50_03460 [Fimbriimonadales bacterium]
MALSDEQRDLVRSALAKDRLRTLLGVVHRVAALQLDEDYNDTRLWKMAVSNRSERLRLIQGGMRASKLMRKIGDAIYSKEISDVDLLVMIDELVLLDHLDGSAIVEQCRNI